MGFWYGVASGAGVEGRAGAETCRVVGAGDGAGCGGDEGDSFAGFSGGSGQRCHCGLIQGFSGMAGQDFEVDHETLKTTAQQIAETTQPTRGTSINSCVPAGQDLANDGLARVVDEFRDRWERATTSMTEDVDEMAKRIEGIAANYATYEAVVEKKVNALKGAMDSLSGSGASLKGGL